MVLEGVFKGWLPERRFGFVRSDEGSREVFVHMSIVLDPASFRAGARVLVQVQTGAKGLSATEMSLLQDDAGEALLSEDIEPLDTEAVDESLLEELARWKREAKAEDNDRYFWHVRETDQIAQGDKYFVIGRKGSGKTAICEYFNRQRRYDLFSEKLSFKNFPFNELYSHKNEKYTPPNQFITLFKYLIYSTVCRLMLQNEAISEPIRSQLSQLYDDDTSLSRRIGKWVGREFGVSLFGISVTMSKSERSEAPRNWVEHVDFLEDLLLRHAGEATYFVLFDELDEDYRDIIQSDQYEQYSALITSLFKAVQDVRTTFGPRHKVFPVIFLRDDIYDLVQDADKNKWGDFKVDLDWDSDKIRRLIAFRISRAIEPNCVSVLTFEEAWERVFGRRQIRVGKGGKHRISTFEFIARSTLLRPRDFVAYLQACSQYAVENGGAITPDVVKRVDKAFSNYLRQELTDELFALLPDIENILDAISQLRKWNFSIHELERAYLRQVGHGFIKEGNVKFVLQALFLFSVIGNNPNQGRYVFRYQNREARLNFNERVVVHRGLFKALQIL